MNGRSPLLLFLMVSHWLCAQIVTDGTTGFAPPGAI